MALPNRGVTTNPKDKMIASTVLTALRGQQKDSKLSPNKTAIEVANVFGIEVSDLTARCRREELVIPRHIYVKLLRDSGYGYSEIARLMNRDHGTAINSVRRAQEIIETDRRYRRQISELRELGYRL